MSVPVYYEAINESLCRYAKYLFPEIDKTYVGPSIQNTELPCVFITPMPNSTVRPDTVNFDRSFLRTLKFDMCYMVQYNTNNLFELYQSKADILDYNMEFIPYYYLDDNQIEQRALIRAYNRNHTVDLNGLHYKFELKLRVFRQHDDWDLIPYIKDYSLVINVLDED